MTKSAESWEEKEEIEEETRDFNKDPIYIYSKKEHRQWVDNFNKGVAHFGCLPANCVT